jgi:hypothetical protein
MSGEGGAYFLSMKMFYISLVSSVILIGCASTGTTNSNTGVTVTSVDEGKYSMKSRGWWPYLIASKVPIKIADPD